MSKREKESKKEHEVLSASAQFKSVATPEKNLRFNLPPKNKKTVLNQHLGKMLIDRLSDVRNKIIKETKRTMNPNRIEELMKKLLKQKEELANDRK